MVTFPAELAVRVEPAALLLEAVSSHSIVWSVPAAKVAVPEPSPSESPGK